MLYRQKGRRASALGELPVVSRRKSGAFTLVELLAVVAIIVLLLSILTPSMSKAREQANISMCLTNLKALCVSFSVYTGENNQWYPASSANGGVIYGDGDGPEFAWDTILQPYYQDYDALHCPSDEIDREWYYEEKNIPEERRHRRSYGMNGYVSGMGPSNEGGVWSQYVHRATEVSIPNETILLADMWDSDYGLWNTSGYYGYAPNIYGAYQGGWFGRYSAKQEEYPIPGRMPTYYHRNDTAANFAFCDGHATLLPENHPHLEDSGDCYYYYRVK